MLWVFISNLLPNKHHPAWIWAFFFGMIQTHRPTFLSKTRLPTKKKHKTIQMGATPSGQVPALTGGRAAAGCGAAAGAGDMAAELGQEWKRCDHLSVLGTMRNQTCLYSIRSAPCVHGRNRNNFITEKWLRDRGNFFRNGVGGPEVSAMDGGWNPTHG